MNCQYQNTAICLYREKEFDIFRRLNRNNMTRLHHLRTVEPEQTPIALQHRRPLRGRNENTPGKLAVPTMEGVSIERVQDIVSLEAKGNYTVIHFNEKRQLLVCKTLGDLEASLAQNGFFIRIHRSYSINLDRLQRYIKGKGGHVVMDNGDSIEVSSTRKHELIEALRDYFGFE